jgi:type IV pilus assembly protein PilW
MSWYTMDSQHRSAPDSAQGHTLVELLVALTIGTIIMLALTILFASNSRNQQDLEHSLRQVEGARFSLDMMSEDLMHAGYFSDLNPDTLADAPAYQTPNPCAIAPDEQGWNTATTPVEIPVPLQGIAAGAVVGCLTSRLASTEAVVIRRSESGPTITWADGKPSNVYIQVARCTNDPQRLIAAPVPVGNPEAVFKLRRPDCASANNALRRLTQRTYYIASCNDCAADDGIPTLKRVEVIDGVLRRTSIAEGVENLQVEYGLDTNGDGQPDRFATMGSGVIDGVDPNVWQNVVTVRLHLLTRSTQRTPGYADIRTYQLGPDVTLPAPNDGFKRTLLTSTVRLHNVGGRRE